MTKKNKKTKGDPKLVRLLKHSDDLLQRSRELQNRAEIQHQHVVSLHEQGEQLCLKSRELMEKLK